MRIEGKFLAWKVLEDGEADGKEGWKLLSARERRDAGASSSDEDPECDAGGLEVVRVQECEAVGVEAQRMKMCLVSSSKERCLRILEGKRVRIANESPVVRLVPRVLDHRSPPIIGSKLEVRLMVCSDPIEGRRAPERGLAWLVGIWISYVVSSMVCGVECGEEGWRGEDEGEKWGKGEYRKGHSGQKIGLGGAQNGGLVGRFCTIAPGTGLDRPLKNIVNPRFKGRVVTTVVKSDG